MSTSHKSFITSMASLKEPSSCTQADKDSKWHKAMHTELEALEKNQNCTITSLPSGKVVICCKWIYKIKYLAYDSIERYKTRLVAKWITKPCTFRFR